MSIKERRDAEKVEMKMKIRNAAIEIIEQEGYEKLSIRKIATRIDYSPTTIYLYYKDKAEIIADMSDELYNKVLDNVFTILNEDTVMSVDKKVHKIMRAFIIGLCGEPEMVKAILYSGVNVIFANDSDDSTPNNSGISMLDNIFADGIAQNVFRPNIVNTSWMIVSALLGFTISSIENQIHLTDNFNQLIDDFVNILLGGMLQ